MKVTTNSTHKSFKTKENIKQKAMRTIQKIGTFIAISGFIVNCSGCSNYNNNNQKATEKYEQMNKAVMDMYESGTLPSQSINQIDMYFAKIGNEFIDELPKDLQSLSLYEDMYITDLSNLPNVCPSLQVLTLENCHSISNFEFIKELKDLRKFKIFNDAIGVTEDLIAYLDSRGIEHNLDNRLVDMNNQIDNIVDEIISEDMTDREKMNTIAIYVFDHLEYDYSAYNNVDLAIKYNYNPIESALSGKGICASFAAFTNVLAIKAGLVSYYLFNDNHGWNLVFIDGKYYYIDTTSVGVIPYLSEHLVKKYSVGFNYMQDPFHSELSSMSNLDELPIPTSLLELVKEANDKKSFIEKYGSNSVINSLAVLGVLLGINIGLVIYLCKSSKKNEKKASK